MGNATPIVPKATEKAATGCLWIKDFTQPLPKVPATPFYSVMLRMFWFELIVGILCTVLMGSTETKCLCEKGCDGIRWLLSVVIKLI